MPLFGRMYPQSTQTPITYIGLSGARFECKSSSAPSLSRSASSSSDVSPRVDVTQRGRSYGDVNVMSRISSASSLCPSSNLTRSERPIINIHHLCIKGRWYPSRGPQAPLKGGLTRQLPGQLRHLALDRPS